MLLFVLFGCGYVDSAFQAGDMLNKKETRRGWLCLFLWWRGLLLGFVFCFRFLFRFPSGCASCHGGSGSVYASGCGSASGLFCCCGCCCASVSGFVSGCFYSSGFLLARLPAFGFGVSGSIHIALTPCKLYSG